MDLDSYLTTNVLDHFAETFGIRSYPVDVNVVVGAGVTTLGLESACVYILISFHIRDKLRVQIDRHLFNIYELYLR